MENRSVFDTLISSLIGDKEVHGLRILIQAFNRIQDEKDKAINKNEETQQFLDFFVEILINYAKLVLQNPDVFPEMLPMTDEYEGPALSAFRIVHIIEEMGCPT